jgi:hypothetical protein
MERPEIFITLSSPPVILVFLVLWVGLSLLAFHALRNKLWATLVMGLTYLAFGVLAAPWMFGGQGHFLYDPARLWTNLIDHGGWLAIIMWPLYASPGFGR